MQIKIGLPLGHEITDNDFSFNDDTINDIVFNLSLLGVPITIKDTVTEDDYYVIANNPKTKIATVKIIDNECIISTV